MNPNYETKCTKYENLIWTKKWISSLTFCLSLWGLEKEWQWRKWEQVK